MKKIFLIYTVVLILLMVLPLNSKGELNNVTILSFRGDYFLHSLLLLPWFLFAKLFNKSAFYWGIIGLTYAIALESLQFVLPYRTFNINDLMANGLGVVFSSVIFIGFRKRKI